MADDTLFEFLHMEIVAHMYKEQATREDIDKVPSTSMQIQFHQICSTLIKYLLQRFAILHLHHVLICFLKERVTCVSTLEVMGFRVGQGLIERYTQLCMYFFHTTK